MVLKLLTQRRRFLLFVTLFGVTRRQHCAEKCCPPDATFSVATDVLRHFDEAENSPMVAFFW